MLQETGCYVGKKRIVWVKVNPDYEILFRLMDGLRPDTERRYWIREHGKDGNICDNGKIMTGVNISFSVSHNTMTSVEEYMRMRNIHLKSEIAQLELSDLGREVHACRKHSVS